MAEMSLGLRIGAALSQSYSRVMGRAERDVRGLDAQADNLARGQRNMGAALNDATASLHNQVLGAAALAAAFAAPVQAAVRFESAMADVRKVVDFPTPEAFRQMGDDILSMSTTIPVAAEGLADIVAAAGQAGIAREELLRFTEDAAKMGVAFDLSGKQAGGAMTGLRSIFKLNQDQVVLLGDSYNHLSNNMDATARDMLNISNRAGSMGALFGLTGEQIGALGATFLALKTPPEVAATGINALLLKLSAADKQSSKFQDALGTLGLTATGLKDAIKQDAQGALLSFLEAVEGAPDQIGVLSDLFGAEYADDITKLVGGLDTYRKSLSLVGDSTQYAGSMTAEYQARAATTANSLQLFQSQVNRLGVVLGEVLLPPVTRIVGGLGTMVDWVVTATDKVPGLGTALVVLGGVVAGLKIVAMLTPIGAAVTGIALAATLIVSYWEPISAFFKGLWEGVTTVFSAGWKTITDLIGWDPLPMLRAVWGAAAAWLDSINPLRKLQEGWEKVAGAIGQVWSWVSGGEETPTAGATQAAVAAPPATAPLEPQTPATPAATAPVIGAAQAAATPPIARQAPTLSAAIDRAHAGIVTSVDALPARIAAALAAATIAATPAAGAGRQIVLTVNAPITINASPGADADAIGTAARREVEGVSASAVESGLEAESDLLEE